MHKLYKSGLLILAISFGCGRDTSSDLNLSADSDSINATPSLAVIGDSISTGVFASTKIGVWPGDRLQKYIAKAASEMKFSVDVKNLGDPRKITARKLGKVITFNREQFSEALNKSFHEATDLEEVEQRYATTTSAWGLRHNLASSSNVETTEIESFLAARFGATYRSTPDLTKNLLDQYLKRPAKDSEFRASHLAVVLGANDFCSDQTVEQVEERLRTTITTLAKLHPQAKIAIGTVPPLLALKDHDCEYDLNIPMKIKINGGGKKVLGIEIPSEINETINIGKAITCDQLRKSYCSRLYADDAKQRLDNLNEMIAATIAQWPDEQLRDRLREISGLRTMTISREQLAFDGFHPSIEGQQAFAQHIGISLTQ